MTNQIENFELNKRIAEKFNKNIFIGLFERADKKALVFSCVCDTMEQAADKLKFRRPYDYQFIKLEQVTKRTFLNPNRKTYHLLTA